MKTIEITVAPDGSSRVETKGFQGAQCQSATRFLEQSLGAKHGEVLKPEFFATNTSSSLEARES